jgi:hypothetical protein
MFTLILKVGDVLRTPMELQGGPPRLTSSTKFLAGTTEFSAATADDDIAANATTQIAMRMV